MELITDMETTFSSEILPTMAWFRNKSTSFDKHLEEKDYIMGSALLPVTIFVTLLMISGSLGNFVVVYVYLVKWKEESVKYFIGCLAMLDLVTSCFCMPIEMSMLVHPVVQNSAALCKLLRFSRTVTSISSGLVLVVIAVDRHRRICLYGHPQINVDCAKKLCLIAIATSVVVAWPALVLFGAFDRYDYSVIETGCSITQSMRDQIYPTLYYATLFLIFFGVTVCLFVCYILVGVKLCKLPRRRAFTIPRSSSGTCSSRDPWSNILPNNKSKDVEQRCMSLPGTLKSGGTLPRQKTNTISQKQANNSIKRHTSILDFNKFRERLNSSLEANARSRRRHRMTFTLFLISALVFIAFVPYIVLMICNAVIPEFTRNLTSGEQVMYNVGILSHFLSSGINPFIYGFFSKNFRNKLKEINQDFWEKLSIKKNVF